MGQVFSGKKTLYNMRLAFQDAPWLRRIALRYMARKIAEEDLLIIDDRIGKRLPLEEMCPSGDRNRKRVLFYIRILVDGAPDVQGETLKCMARKVGVQGLQKLESMIGTLKKNPEKFIV